ncbi:MAG: T9SS type A sorting domain-containing protein [Sphingobacteriales bacterium]|nr:MAG: T9SS type A sorting domain-containing protein [Sphingobacteriales bacterium]
MMLKSTKMIACAALLFSCSISSLQAQTFTAPIADEHVFGSIDVRKPTHIFSYSNEYVESPFGLVNLYLTGWGNPEGASEFVWQFTDPNTTNVIAKGSFIYKEVNDVVVSSMIDEVTNRVQIIVAYHKKDVGHFMDIYEITGSTTDPVAYISTTPLSDSKEYGRISIDASYKYKVGIIWHHKDADAIQTIFGLAGTWQGIKTLDGTNGQMEPDIAFGMEDVSFVYHDGSGTITKLAIPQTSLTGPAALVYPTVQDVNPTGMTLTSKIILDCPDHMDVGFPSAPGHNWAYTYTNNSQVLVRYIEYNGPAVITTTSINSGALGNVPTFGAYKAFSPSIHYGINNSTDNITVCWYTTDYSSSHSYIGLQMDPLPMTGPVLTNIADYMGLPNGATSAPEDFPVIAVSKSDLELISEYFYVAYSTYNASNDQFELHHAFHKWMNPVFRGLPEEHTSPKSTSIANSYPNPFTDVINVPLNFEKGGTVHIQLVDLLGRRIMLKELKAEQFNATVQLSGLSEVAPGTYLLQTRLNGKIMSTKSVIKK